MDYSSTKEEPSALKDLRTTAKILKLLIRSADNWVSKAQRNGISARSLNIKLISVKIFKVSSVGIQIGKPVTSGIRILKDATTLMIHS